MTRWSGSPPQCPHCQYKIWQWDEWNSCNGICPRCKRNMKETPVDDGMETVTINGRTVTRKKPNANS